MRSGLFDSLGIAASGTCLVHCLAMPMLAAWLPALGAFLKWPEQVHLGAVLLAMPVGAAALIPGWRHHGRILPLLLGALAMIALGGSLLAGSRPLIETALTVAGAIALAGAHIGNWRFRRAFAPGSWPEKTS